MQLSDALTAISVLGAVVVCIGIALDRVNGTTSETTQVISPSPQTEEEVAEERTAVSVAQRLPHLSLGEPQS